MIPEAILPDTWFTPRLRARRPRVDDTDAVFKGWARDVDVTRFLTWRPHRRSEDTRAFLAGCVDAWDTTRRRTWALTRFDTTTLLG